jgi:hypothetical protein
MKSVSGEARKKTVPTRSSPFSSRWIARASPGELRYHESRELAGRAYRQDFGSVAHRALIPHQSRGKLINGQPPEAGSEITQWLAKSNVVRPRALSRKLKF